jgi:predicted dehydrogenase
MVRVGLVGIGFMGMIHYLAYRNVGGAKVTAIATRDSKRLAGDWRGIQGNFGPPGEQMDLGPIGRYADWREMLKDPNVDLVDVCLPSSLHVDVTLEALKAGKHVLVEKPIALETADGERLVKAARDSGRMLMIAQVLPFFPEYTFAREAIQSGRYGKLLGGHFKRVIADPQWMKDFHDPRSGGGPVIDLHIHDAHFIRLVCGMPKAVFSSGCVRDGRVRFCNTQFVFDDPTLSVTAASGVVDQQGRSFTHAFEIYLEQATLMYDFAVIDGKPTATMPLTVLAEDGKVERPTLPEVDAFALELTEATRAVESGQVSPLLAGDLACDALKLCHREIESIQSGKLVAV